MFIDNRIVFKTWGTALQLMLNIQPLVSLQPQDFKHPLTYWLKRHHTISKDSSFVYRAYFISLITCKFVRKSKSLVANITATDTSYTLIQQLTFKKKT